MKKLFFLFPLCLLTYFSCTKEEDPEVTNQLENELVLPIRTYDGKGNSKIYEYEENRVVKIISTNEGLIEESTYSYDEQERLINIVGRDGLTHITCDSAWLSYGVTNEGDNFVDVIHWRDVDKMDFINKTKLRFVLNDEMRVVSRELFEDTVIYADGSAIRRDRFKYDGSIDPDESFEYDTEKSMFLNVNQSLFCDMEYGVISTGKNNFIKSKDAKTGVVIWEFSFEYNADGYPIKEYSYNEDGSVDTSYVEYNVD